MLSKDHIIGKLKTHKSEFAKFGVRGVGLFGSYLNGNHTDKSDIDLLVDFEPSAENFDNFMAICDLLEQLFKNEKVEVVTLNGLSPYIGPKILKEVQYV